MYRQNILVMYSCAFIFVDLFPCIQSGIVLYIESIAPHILYEDSTIDLSTFHGIRALNWVIPFSSQSDPTKLSPDPTRLSPDPTNILPCSYQTLS